MNYIKTGEYIYDICYIWFLLIQSYVFDIKERLEKEERCDNANCRPKENYENKAGKKDENTER